MPLRFEVLLALVLGTPALAQGTATPYGSACGLVGGPALSLQGIPEPGGSLTATASNLHLGPSALLLVGVSDAVSPFGPLPLPLPTPLFAPGCSLLTSAELSFPMAGGPGGTASLSATLGPGANDYHLYLQAIVVNSFGEWSASQGLDVHVLAPPSGQSDLSGTVDLLTGGPSIDARVTLFTPDLGAFFETRTDASGRYAFLGVPNGAYRLGVADPGREYEEIGVSLAGAALVQDFALDPESHTGAWQTIGDTLPETLDATDIGLLRPDGTIFYCHDTTDPITFDPATGQKTLPSGSASEQGCMNGTLLMDGSLLFVGGQDGADPGSFTNAISWVKKVLPNDVFQGLGSMLAPNGRWYPGLCRLADGRLLVMGGGTAPSAVRTDTCEIFDPTTETWSFTDSMSSTLEFPPAALLHDGTVLRTWGAELEVFDPQTETWSTTGQFNFPNRGYPGHSDHSLIVLADGRAVAVGIDTNNEPLGTMTELFDPATQTWSVGSSPALRRYQCEVVQLPDGQVLVQGGDEQSNPSPEPDVLGIVRRCDLFDPMADTWRRVADTPLFREYHAVTLLVPDGRVVTTGGTKIKFQNQNPLSADIDAYSPPYLFRGVRPQISNLSDSTPARGTSLTFDVFPATALTGAVLLGVQATTHWVDGGIPRRLELAVTQAGGQAQVTLPSDADTLPVGWYLLFGMVDDIPSVALFLRVDP